MIFNLKNYKVATYIRLSIEDGDRFESESVSNQREIIASYIENNKLSLAKEYIDDGYTGTNFNRPKFNELLEDIKEQKINMIITKDLSRLGRDYIQIGNYIENYFPENDVRYISILDNIDTYLENDSDIIPIKALLNDMYSKDISKKVSSAKQEKIKQGIYKTNIPLYGYIKNSNMQGGLEIDVNASEVIKLIYKLKYEKNTLMQIVKYLETHNIKTPSMHMNHNRNTFKRNNSWNIQSVRRILTNEMYIGNYVGGKKKTINYKTKQRAFAPKELWSVVENTHEAIIDKELFWNVQNKDKYTYNPKVLNPILDVLFKDMIFCKQCGNKILFKYHGCNNNPKQKIYLRCPLTAVNYNFCDNKGACNYFKIEDAVLEHVSEIYEKYFNKIQSQENIVNNIEDAELRELEIYLFNAKTELEEINMKLANIYSSRLDGKIDENIFKDNYSNFNKERIIKENYIKDYTDKVKNINSFTDTNRTEVILKILDSITNKETISKDIIKKLISKISVNKYDICIEFKFKELNIL